MAIKLKTVGEYRRAIEALRRFADGFSSSDGFDLRKMRSDLAYAPTDPRHFDNPLTKSQKSKVSRYFDILQRHAGYKGYHYQHFRDSAKLKSAQKAIGMPSKGSWRGVFVPQPSENTPARMVKRGSGKNAMWVVEYPKADKVFVPFDRVLLADLGTEYVRSLFARLPKSYQYAITMGTQSRERLKTGGNLDQMLRDLDFMMQTNLAGQSGTSHFSEYITGVWVYRGGQDRFNEIKKEHFKTVKSKHSAQEQIKKLIRKERRRLHDYEEYLRLSKKYSYLNK